MILSKFFKLIAALFAYLNIGGMNMLTRSVLAKCWQQATIKNNIIFNWVFGENRALFKGLVERLFQRQVGNFAALTSERSFKNHQVFYRPRFDTYGEDDLDNIINVELQSQLPLTKVRGL